MPRTWEPVYPYVHLGGVEAERASRGSEENMVRNIGKNKRPALPMIRNEVLEFRSSLTPETDRGVALVCAAYLETELEGLLRKAFVDVPKVVEHLFEPSGTIGTLSSKIDLALAIGQIESETHRGLH